jgi:hypothetical protein
LSRKTVQIVIGNQRKFIITDFKNSFILSNLGVFFVAKIFTAPINQEILCQHLEFIIPYTISLHQLFKDEDLISEGFRKV